MRIKCGSRRIVFIFDNFVVKIPKLKSLKSFCFGVLENLHERYWWAGESGISTWESSTHQKLAKIYWADRHGLCVVMEKLPITYRYQSPYDWSIIEIDDTTVSDPISLTHTEINDMAEFFSGMDIASDCKANNIGRRENGDLVLLDYGYFNAINQMYLGVKV